MTPREKFVAVLAEMGGPNTAIHVVLGWLAEEALDLDWTPLEFDTAAGMAAREAACRP